MKYGNYDVIGIIFIIIGFIITFIADRIVKSSYYKYRTIQSKKSLTGFEVARKILDDNGLASVHVVEVKGVLTDHYDPVRKVVRLSHDVFNGDSIASVSVAAHECGHAIQDKDKYVFLNIRSLLVPFVNFSSRVGYFAILIGIIFNALKLAWVGIGLLLIILLFQLITLPVEFNASKRAKICLDKSNILFKNEIDESAQMLRAAAFTYVASLVTTLLQILRLILIVLGRDRRD